MTQLSCITYSDGQSRSLCLIYHNCSRLVQGISQSTVGTMQNGLKSTASLKKVVITIKIISVVAAGKIKAFQYHLQMLHVTVHLYLIFQLMQVKILPLKFLFQNANFNNCQLIITASKIHLQNLYVYSNRVDSLQIIPVGT